MKLRNHIYMLLAALAVFLMASCSPDDFGFGKKTYTPEELVEGEAYTVTIDGNVVTLKSLVSGCTPLWITPSGRSEEANLTLDMPFAGDYEVTFGVMTPGGIVYGAPYKFKLNQNDFTMLTDRKWFNLSDADFDKNSELPDEETLIAGISKKWYPCNANYGIGQCTGPVMYIAPYDPEHDGTGYTADEEKNQVYKDIVFGTGNWAPNYDPGFQSWLIPEDDPYMDSYMEFSMDAANGCVAKMYRGESGKKGSSTGTSMVGKFNLNLSDKTKPFINFSDCYAMHSVGFDAVCSNYTQDIQIVELTPYILQLVTKRTNSEGNWYICWNFVSEEVVKTHGTCIPKEEASLIQKTNPVLPEFNNLTTDLFKTEIANVEYVGSQMTFNLNADEPYDFLWWNGSPKVNAWEKVIGGKYNNTWAPKVSDTALDGFELVISKSDGQYKYECGDVSGVLKIEDGKLVFDKEISIVAASSDKRSIVVKGKEFTVLANEPGESLTFGVPESLDENGNICSYCVANLTYKKVATGPTGPTVIKVDNSKLNCYLQEKGKYYRIELYNPWGDKDWPIDISTVKVKKNQTLSITFKVEGIDWKDGKEPKAALCHNWGDGGLWEPSCFNDPAAVQFNKSGETTVTWTNNTGATVTYKGTSCVTVAVQLEGYGSAPVFADGNLDTDKVKATVTSITIQ